MPILSKLSLIDLILFSLSMKIPSPGIDTKYLLFENLHIVLIGYFSIGSIMKKEESILELLVIFLNYNLFDQIITLLLSLNKELVLIHGDFEYCVIFLAACSIRIELLYSLNFRVTFEMLSSGISTISVELPM